jgi:hypothetical protein
MATTHTRTVLVGSTLLAFTMTVGVATVSAQSADPTQRQPGQSQPQPGAQPVQPQPSPAPAPTDRGLGQSGDRDRGQAGDRSTRQAEMQTARGEISDVDATTKMITIKPTEGAEQKFTYTDATKVTGARGGVAGLATMSGREVVVHFSGTGANRVVTEIEIQPQTGKQ